MKAERNKGGRPPAEPRLQRVNLPLRLPRWLVEWIDAQGGTRAGVFTEQTGMHTSL